MLIRILTVILIYSRAVWGYISSRLPQSKLLSKLSTGLLTAWNTALSYRSVSLALLQDYTCGLYSPSRSFRRGIFGSPSMLKLDRGVSHEESWGFHANIEENEHPRNSVPFASRLVKDSLASIAEKIYSRVSFMQEESARKSISIEVVETTEYSEKVNLSGLWQWENDEAESAFFLTTNERKTLLTMSAEHDSKVTGKEATKWQLLQLQRSPSFVHSLRIILERAHWVCRDAHTDYAAQVTIVGDDLVVGFRGTANLRDLAIDLRIDPAEGPYGVRVHRGFLDVLKAVNRDNHLTDLITSLVKKRGLKRVIVTGYSLGGAVANLFLLGNGAEMARQGIDIRAVTFGCPRFIETDEASKLPYRLTSRIINAYVEGDPIPLNLTAMLGFTDYCHVGNSMVVQSNGENIQLTEERQDNTADMKVQWWGLHTPLSHLTDNYERTLKQVEENLSVFQDAKFAL